MFFETFITIVTIAVVIVIVICLIIAAIPLIGGALAGLAMVFAGIAAALLHIFSFCARIAERIGKFFRRLFCRKF